MPGRAPRRPLTHIWAFDGPHRFLSNFYRCLIVYEGITYPSVEHAFQAMKSLDGNERRRISGISTAAGAKRAGRMVPLRHDWNVVRIPIMRDLLRLKFDPEKKPDLAQMLIDTGNAELVEGNTWGDRFWGICAGSGENHLGKLLMEVRAEIRR